MAKAIELEAKSPYHRDGFYTTVRDGRLWVFEENSKDLATFLKHGDPVKQVTRIGVGPGGMTIRSSDANIINAYLAAKTGFFTKHEEGRLWVFRAGSPELTSFLEKGEPAKQVTRIGVGPNGETVKSPDGSVIDAYLNAQ